ATAYCAPAVGCVHAANTLPCDDGNACPTNDACSAGACAGGPARNCDDGNVCTTDSCNPATGCMHTPNAASCDDGNVCTTADTCSGGACVGGPPLVCPTGVPVAVVEADTYVSSSSPSTNFGTSKVASADAGPTVQRAFFRVRVSGVGTRQVTSARVRLQVATVTNAQSVSGGRIHPITDCGWNERTMTWQTQPTIDGPVIATAGAVVVADTYVQSDKPTTNFGTKTYVAVDNGSPSAPGGAGVQRSFLRVKVTGVGTRPVSSAHLQLQVASATNAQSVAGGSLHAITGCSWDERTVTWNTQPAIDGPALVTLGAVAQGQTVDFDVTAAIPGDGTYCFALDTSSTDSAIYNSREGSQQRPAMVVQVAQ